MMEYRNPKNQLHRIEIKEDKANRGLPETHREVRLETTAPGIGQIQEEDVRINVSRFDCGINLKS